MLTAGVKTSVPLACITGSTTSMLTFAETLTKLKDTCCRFSSARLPLVISLANPSRVSSPAPSQTVSNPWPSTDTARGETAPADDFTETVELYLKKGAVFSFETRIVRVVFFPSSQLQLTFKPAKSEEPHAGGEPGISVPFPPVSRTVTLNEALPNLPGTSAKEITPDSG